MNPPVTQEQANQNLPELVKPLELDEDYYQQELEGNTLTITNDQEGQEQITITVEVNQYGVPIYTLDVQSASDDDELETSQVQAQCYDRDFTTKEANKMDAEATDKSNKWLNAPHLELSLFNGNIKFRTAITEVDCHTQMSHVHEYLAVYYTCTTSDPSKITRLIDSRDELVALYAAYVNKK